MIFRRFFCLLISSLLVFASFSYAEENEKQVEFEVVDNGKEISLKTSLLPGRDITLWHPEGNDTQMIFSYLTQPGFFADCLNSLKRAIIDRNKTEGSVLYGYYTGDLFEEAFKKEELILSSDELKLLLADISKYYEYGETETTGIAAGLFSRLISRVTEEDTVFSISTYNEDRFITIEVIQNDLDLMTLSLDYPDENTVGLLIGTGAGDAIYYEEVSCTKSDGKYNYSISLFRTEGESFRQVSEQDCLNFCELHTGDMNILSYDFDGEIQSVLMPAAAYVAGRRSISKDGNGKISVKISSDSEISDALNILRLLLTDLSIRD